MLYVRFTYLAEKVRKYKKEAGGIYENKTKIEKIRMDIYFF